MRLTWQEKKRYCHGSHWPILRIVRIVGKRVALKPLSRFVRDAFLAEARRRGVAEAEVWDHVKGLRFCLMNLYRVC
jgi:hypothetical protein